MLLTTLDSRLKCDSSINPPCGRLAACSVTATRSRQLFRIIHPSQADCCRSFGGRMKLLTGVELCDYYSPLLPPHWFSWLPNRRRHIVTPVGIGTTAASPIILGISNGGVTGGTAGPAFKWAGSSASDARLGGSTGTAKPCRDTAGTDRDGILRLQASISGLNHADQRSG
jgi:hypothetical protein